MLLHALYEDDENLRRQPDTHLLLVAKSCMHVLIRWTANEVLR